MITNVICTDIQSHLQLLRCNCPHSLRDCLCFEDARFLGEWVDAILCCTNQFNSCKHPLLWVSSWPLAFGHRLLWVSSWPLAFGYLLCQAWRLWVFAWACCARFACIWSWMFWMGTSWSTSLPLNHQKYEKWKTRQTQDFMWECCTVPPNDHECDLHRMSSHEARRDRRNAALKCNVSLQAIAKTSSMTPFTCLIFNPFVSATDATTWVCVSTPGDFEKQSTNAEGTEMNTEHTTCHIVRLKST